MELFPKFLYAKREEVYFVVNEKLEDCAEVGEVVEVATYELLGINKIKASVKIEALPEKTK